MPSLFKSATGKNEILSLYDKKLSELNIDYQYKIIAEDRIATERGDLQIYGGQIKYYPATKSFDVWPIVDPENVDKRRAEIGLESMSEFLKNRRTPMEWDLENQIKRSKAFEEEKNNEK